MYVGLQNSRKKLFYIPLAECNGKTIAFHAVLSKRLLNTTPNTIIKFGNVLVNEGNRYNPSTGKFTAPQDGVYLFSWAFQTSKCSSAYIGGSVDGKILARVASNGQTLQVILSSN